ncbi:MAG: fumarate hydratase [Chloroflexi bacterium]|nr:fumarate hydratase [Chloroflexota bacterium]
MITEDLIAKGGYMAMKNAVLAIPPDMYDALRKEYRKERSPDARGAYERLFEHFDHQTELGKTICSDTGTIMYYVSIGSRARLDPELSFWRALGKVTVALTRESFVAPKSADPIRRINNDLNVGENSPSLQYKYVENLDYIEITAVAKGGGGEMSGSRFRMLLAADGLAGIKKFVIDSTVSSAMGGLTCPPVIVGVGVGGGLGIAGALAHEAAVLRPAGSRHPDRYIAELEEELLKAINRSGVGPYGLGGGCTALDVHVEFSNGHEGVVATGVVAQCLMAHRATVRVHNNGAIEPAPYPVAWFTRPWLTYQEAVTQ